MIPLIENFEFTVNVPRETVMSRFTNPFFFVGSLGHVAILELYDESSQNFVMPSQATSPNFTKFHVAYLFGAGKAWIKIGNGVKTKEGFLEGPIYSPLGISYRGELLDHETKFEMDISVNKMNAGSLVKIMVNITSSSNFWLKASGFNFSEFMEHMIKGHVVPIMSGYPVSKSMC
ncbi:MULTISPECIES: hypothetical protein [Metallosphaera]|uniref:Uncharacterized protein n=3 Tax=Metallosphaera TaxID=41980 RepID=A4YG52_METS5|nr:MULTISPECIES: hypothetical protein [Metallosphaera]ABP95404.1 hypothetical protein Msed_1244 [Metallosphaera sedula DSM 5348]AIM27389.1 hypothetical protein HA72_1244 [Metallosphaera sedula]AKV74267.1 hypothetical protein MsedA_1263 [Metallosphaera sedula]AKV76506.1 hypothetical protein MsedB_1265 [Metallosphaera sedula]AKV78758.1 hypothetical protein MsedC_1263 [Metallosphaera sedula]